MKYLLFVILTFFYSGLIAQSQIGSDIDGEATDDNSGVSVSLSSTGTRVAIGATNNDGNGSNSGHVRIYEESGGTWTQVGNDIDGEAADDQSGISISLSSTGDRVAIGASANDGNGNLSGHTRIYEESGGTWTQVGSDIDGEASADFSGRAVDLSSTGDCVAIGALFNDGNGSSSGHVRIYKESGGTWTQVGSDIDGEAASDLSGISVSLSSAGTRVAIGAYLNDGNGSNSGHVRIFEEIVLPVELYAFYGQESDNRVMLFWQTASERNNKGFEVQKTKAGTDWQTIGFVKGKGTTNEFNEYTFQDRNPYSGINYYRLKQLDHDGKYGFSEVISVLLKKGKDIRIFPNPTSGIVQIIGVDNGNYVIADCQGERLKTGTLDGRQINISKFPNGVYHMQIIHKGDLFSKSIIKH